MVRDSLALTLSVKKPSHSRRQGTKLVSLSLFLWKKKLQTRGFLYESAAGIPNFTTTPGYKLAKIKHGSQQLQFYNVVSFFR